MAVAHRNVSVLREGRLPARGTFVGRAQELETLDRCVREGSHIVTIMGPAGIGKTRLALEWAREARGMRLLFCDLSEARDLDDACAAVGRTLGVPLVAGGSAEDAVEKLGHALAQLDDGVVILDNLEQLVDEAPRMLGPWLSLAPNASFVVTSRERLRLDEEICVPLDPMTPTDGAALFLARARVARGDLTLGEPDAEHVAAIVRRLDGIPLAIELCAARAGVLSPTETLARLSRPLDLLVTGARGAPARQATLRGALDWSWDLLEDREKSALAQCSVFAGGFSLEAGEAVLDVGGASALDVLQSLHEKSLLRAGGEERRFGMLESIREYAAEKLAESGGTAAAVERHARFFVGIAGPQTSAVPRPPDVRRVALEVDNLIAACTRALARKPLDADAADIALRGLLALEPVLLTCAEGRLEPFVAMLDAALEAPAPANRILRTRALYTRALSDLLRGRVLDCLLGFQRSLDEARAAGSKVDEALALSKLGVFFDQAGRVDDARASFDAARAIALELDDPALNAEWTISYAGALNWRGQTVDALHYAEQAAAGFHAAGDARGEAIACALAALACMSLGRLDEAEAAAARAIALREQSADRRTEAYVLTILGRVDQSRGRLPEARARFERALGIQAAVGDRLSEGVLRGYLGHVAFEERRLEDARASYRDALALLRESGDAHHVCVFRGALGATLTALGDFDAAAPALEGAAAGIGGPRPTTTRVAVDLFRAYASLSRARRGDGDLELTRRAASAAIALAEAPAPDGSLAPARCAEDVRTALRLLARELSLPDEATDPPRVAPSAAPVLVVGPEARWFRVGDREPVRLLKSRAARLILFRLVRERSAAPGNALPLAELFQAGWPDERIAAKAASNRVYVTLTKLRHLGLAGLVLSRDDGFLVDPEATVLESLEPEAAT